MIGLDTNVLVRHLVQDDPAQSARASAFIEESLTRQAPGFINRIVLVDLIWVLETSYSYARELVAGTVERLLQTAELVVEDADDVAEALRRPRIVNADLVDLLLGVGNARRGCTTTYTFDRRVTRADGFTAL